MPLVERANSQPVPATWCVIACEQGCSETWTVDVSEFDPPLTTHQVEDALTPELLAHERDCHGSDVMSTA